MIELLPTIKYDGRTVVDITKSYDIINHLKSNVDAYELFHIPMGMRIEQLAEQLYGDQNLYWIILMLNDMVDPFYDYPLDPTEMEQFIDMKYTDPTTLVNSKNDIRHYQYNSIAYGWISSGTLTANGANLETLVSQGAATRFTYHDYEVFLNDEKRKIKVLRPQYVDQLVTALAKTISQK